jgi:hypothetical protein
MHSCVCQRDQHSACSCRCALPPLGAALAAPPRAGAPSCPLGPLTGNAGRTYRITPHFTPKTAVSAPLLHAPLSSRLDEISCPCVSQSEPFFGLFGPPGGARGPLPPSNCAKIAGAGAFPPLHPPPAPLRGGLAGLRPVLNPQEPGLSRITSYGSGFQWPCQRIAASPQMCVMCVLGPRSPVLIGRRSIGSC